MTKHSAEERPAQHIHEASYQHSMISGFWQLAAGAELDATATYRDSRPDLGAHYGATRGRCRCGVEVQQLCVEGDTGFSNRRSWVPVADLDNAYAEHAQRSLDAHPSSEAWQPPELEPMDDLEAILDEDAARDDEDDDEDDDECQGHPAGPFDPMGQTVYCDGTCRGKSVRTVTA